MSGARSNSTGSTSSAPTDSGTCPSAHKRCRARRLPRPHRIRSQMKATNSSSWPRQYTELSSSTICPKSRLSGEGGITNSYNKSGSPAVNGQLRQLYTTAAGGSSSGSSGSSSGGSKEDPAA